MLIKAYFILSCLALFCVTDTIFFTDLKFVAILHWAGLWAPFVQQHLSLHICHILVILANYKFFQYYYNWWSVISFIFDVTIVIILNCAHIRQWTWWKKCVLDYFIQRPFTRLCPFLEIFLFWDTIPKFGQPIITRWPPSVQVKGKVKSNAANFIVTLL